LKFFYITSLQIKKCIVLKWIFNSFKNKYFLLVKVFVAYWKALEYLITYLFNCWTKIKWTVKHVYNGHPWDLKFVAIVDRWSLLRDSFMLQKLKMGRQRSGRCRQVVIIHRWSLTQVWLYFYSQQIDKVFRVCFNENSSPSMFSLKSQGIRTQHAIQGTTLNKESFVRFRLEIQSNLVITNSVITNTWL